MSQAEYNTKLQNVHRFIPFLENMIAQLKDPKMKNREQQLSKMESLYHMITDKNKKLKIDTLQKCEEVIIKLYYKVKGENAALPPVPPLNRTASGGDKRKPINVYSLAADSIHKSNNRNDLYGPSSEPSSSNSKSPRPKSFVLRKPPISYSDLECLEKDVAHELEKKMSLNELNTLRSKLCKELENSDSINTTVRNKPVLAKLNAASPDKNKKKVENTPQQPKNETKKEPPVSKKVEVPKVPITKVLKEGDLFCNAFSEIDKTYEKGLKKKEERKSSTHKEKKEIQIDDSTLETTSLKQLSEKAAQLRNVTQTQSIDTTKPEENKETPSNSENSSVISSTISTSKSEDSHNKDDKEKSKSSKETSTDDKDSKRSDKKEKTHKSDHKKEKDEKHKDKNREKCKKDHDKDKDKKENDKDKKDHDKEKKDHDKEKKDQDKEKDKKDHDKDKKDRSKDKSRDKSSKPSEKKDRKSTDKEHDSKKDKKVSNKDLEKDSKTLNVPNNEVEKASKSVEIDTKQNDAGKIQSEIDIGEKDKDLKDDLADLTKKIEDIMNAKGKSQQTVETEIVEKPKIPDPIPIQKKTPEEVKPVNRDPRLKFGVNAVAKSSSQNPTLETTGRLAFKYNPKPRKQEIDNDLEKNLLDSIEKSMKESNIPLPPTKLIAPPAPPDDLFSPESPDEIDKKAVPPILNDLLLNPETTGVINEVVSALRRSNNEQNLINVPVSNIRNIERQHIEQPILSQQQSLHFSPPSQALKFTPPADASIFIPPKPIVSNQSGLYDPFSPTDSGEISNDRNLPEYQMPRNQNTHFEPPNSRLNPYEDRTNQGFYMDRPLNYVPPSPSYGILSPSYVPPSPIYEAGVDNYREMNYHNYQGANPQRFFEGDRGLIRPKGLLGDAPRLPYNKPYGQQNYDDYNRFGPRGNSGNLVDCRPSFYGGVSRDPRVNNNRGPQFPVQDQRPVCRESRMTYREYKEQKERENREREREKREKEALEKQQREREEADQKAKSARDEAEKNQKETETEKNGTADKEKVEDDRETSKFNDRSDRSGSRNRSRDRFSRKRSDSRYPRDRDDWKSRGGRKDRDEKRGRSRERVRYGESKFDKVYSTRDKTDTDISLPLFTSKSNTGKGYVSQYKIPKKTKEEAPSKTDDKKKEEAASRDVKKDDAKDKKKPEKTVKTDISAPKKKVPVVKEANETKEKIQVTDETTKNTEDKPGETDAEENKSKKETEAESKTDIKDMKENNESKDEKEHKEDKPSQPIDKKEEEENILSKFFQNLMKSGNKDEKKGALLSLISTFSDSFSDQQMQKITSIIKSGDVEEEQPKKEEQPQEEPSTTSKDDAVTSEDKEKEIVPEESAKKIEEELKPTEEPEEAEPTIEEAKEICEEEPVERITRQNTTGKVKNRRKSELPKTEIKSKVKVKSELDRLHEDIREMFIRDGVVTATGKRMCRILKDNSAPSNTDNDKAEEDHTEDDSGRKTPGLKKRGRKAALKKNKETSDLEMRQLTVILPKMSLEKMKTTDEDSEKEKKEGESNCNEDKQDEHDQSREPLSEDESDKETEVTKEKSSPIRRGRPKKRNSWATGVIKKKPGPKSRKAKAVISPERNEAKADLDLEIEVPINKDSTHHDKDYYLQIGQKSLQCKFCDVSTKWIAAHYRTEHPDEEVLCSRLPPNMAKAAIDDAIKNKEIYENDEEESFTKQEYTCCFCEYNQITLPRMYRDHVSIHTGEFRHKCPYCNYSRSHIKTMQGHVTEAHGEEEMISKNPIISQRSTNHKNIYAHICELCNFTQMSLENVQRHVKTYHSDAQKCEIYKIKINSEVKIEEDDFKRTVSERPTRRSAKLSQSLNESDLASESNDEYKPQKFEDTEKTPPKPSKVKEDSKTSEIKPPKVEDAENTPPKPSKVKEDSKKPGKKPAAELKNEESSDTKPEDDEKDIETPPKKRVLRRKRGKSISAPGPVTKRLKRKCTLKAQMSSDDLENETSEEEKVVKNIDVAVFTSNTDIQEENKRIEEERMKTMQDINSTIKLRTSLDFVEKLSHRLKQEEEVVVKQEVEDIAEENVLEKLPANDLPVFEKSALQNREIEPTPLRQEITQKDVDKVNPVNGVIEKLQGILSTQATCDDLPSPSVSSEELSLPTPDDAPPTLEVVPTIEPPSLKFITGEANNHPPPLIHMDNVEQTIETTSIINSETLNIGFIKVMKTSSTYIYICCLPPCIFSTRDRTAFTYHCQYYHPSDQSPRTTECFECGATLTSNEDTNLLTCALNHAVTDHSEFFGTKIGSIRISSNLFPEERTKDDDSVFEDDLNPPTISIPSPPGCTADDFDSILEAETVTEDKEEENAFNLRILDVVSLADENLSPIKGSDQDVEAQDSDKEPESIEVQEESTPPRSSKDTPIGDLVLQYQAKAAKQTVNTSRKIPVAFKKFLGNHFDLYKCPDYSCLFTANKRKMFDIHLSMHRNHKNLVNCLYCDKLIVFEYTGDHYEKMHGMCRFSCSYCLYRCIAKDYMDVHQILVHPNLSSRMQLLPKRDSEEKNTISILSEATKGTRVKPYICCNEEFIYQSSFVEHLLGCSDNTNFSCFFKGETICLATHNNARELVEHWGICHQIYPLECQYCDTGDFDLNAMMIHLVLEHPTLPPDIKDRRVKPMHKSKKGSGLQSALCNFKQLAADIRASLKNPSTPETPGVPVTTIVSPKPSTMQKAFENFVVQNTKTTSVLKTGKTYSKLSPINVVKKSPPAISLLKPTSKSNVMNAGGLVYCLSPTSSSPNQVLKAIVVNSDGKTGTVMPQKVQLLSSSPTVDGKFQILKNISKVLPIAPKVVPITPKGIQYTQMMPKLAPLTAAPTVNKFIPSGETVTLQISDAVQDERTESHVEEAIVSEKEDATVEDSIEIDGLDEPMVVFSDDLGNKEQDEAVDPLSLEIEDPIMTEPSKSPQPNATPTHEYDSDSKDVDQQDVLVQKSGLVGYQLFRCAKCDMFFPGGWQLKDHLIKSTQCRFDNVPNKPYKCYHCGKYLKHYTNLLDHLAYHGHPRFTCSLCNKKFPHSNQVRYHMKTQHNVLNVQMQPLIPSKSNMNVDSFIAKPQVVGSVKPVIQETKNECETQKSTEVKTVYFSFEADQIPQKSILGYDVTCGHCKKFKNKVRSNIVRHLLLHENDKEFSVPDTAPVNPVPCLEKNEKMFDKMYNLASSSHTGGRMGGQQKGETAKDKTKEIDHHPAFVPTNKRYQCCAVGCNYLCLEEGNLRHHLTALHMEDLNFVCVHCKKDLSDAVDVDTIIKHLKLHDLHLYKCSYCDHMHNLRHKIERHIKDDHKNKEVSVVVIRAMDAEPYDDNQQQLFTPVVVNQKLPKPWKCCMCKYKCHTEEEAVTHVKNKHNIDCRYKCALCTFKTDDVAEFKEHFKKNHPDNEIDIISAYHKDDDGNGTVTDLDQFDTTPLWLRDKPRVRHIRGILFEEDPAMKKKSAQLKAAQSDQVSKDLPNTSLGKKRKRSMSTFSEASKLEEEFVEPKKEVVELPKGNIQQNNDVIVIEDDETGEVEENNDNVATPVDDQDDVDLICMVGDLGMPLNKHFKCPKCDKYKTTKMREFIQHVAGEVKYYRFMCKICQEKFITLENIQMHCIDFHNCSVSSVAYLKVDQQINRWLTLLLKEQRNIIKGLGFSCEDLPPNIEDFLGTMEVIQKAIKCKECNFSVSGPQALDRHMKYNHPHIAFSKLPRPSTPEPPPQPKPTVPDKKRKPEDPLEGAAETKKLKTMSKNLLAKDKYVCNECKAEFNSVPEMEFHGKEMHDGNVGFSVKTTNMPINVGANRNIYRCRYCPTTGTKANMETHISSDHPGQKIDLYRFSCGVCSAKFEMIKAFRHHFKSHELSEIFFYDVHDKRVNLKPTVKNKLYKCPVCPYSSQSQNSANIKHHLKNHARPFKCDLCGAVFKTRPDAKAHHSKEHPHNTEVISTLEEMMQKINKLMEEVMKNVTDVETAEKTYTDESIEDEVSYPTLMPEVILKTAEDEMVDVETEETNQPKEKKYFAKKSTGGVKKDDVYYSFYGQKREPVDMKKIVTNFEIADAQMKMTCDQLGKIYNLNPTVRVKDCMTLIIEDEDVVSS